MNKKGLKRGFHYDDQSGSMGIWVEGTLVKDYVADAGRTFYVNNITGSSSNGGQSWGDAMDQVSTAVTAADTYQLTHTANNRFVLNNIMVQGTATAYTGVTALANYSRLIGVGANPYGNGGGIPKMGADTMTGSGQQGLLTTTTIRGLYTSGIQWQCNGQDLTCFKVQHMFRSTIEDSTFYNAGGTIGTTHSGWRSTGSIGGLVMRDCGWGTNASRASIMQNGFYIGGTTFNNCRIENCRIAGNVTGVYVISTCVNAQGSTFRNCTIGDLGHSACAIGIDDNSTGGQSGTINFVDCFINAADPIEEGTDTARKIGCIAANAIVQT